MCVRLLGEAGTMRSWVGLHGVCAIRRKVKAALTASVFQSAVLARV